MPGTSTSCCTELIGAYTGNTSAGADAEGASGEAAAEAAAADEEAPADAAAPDEVAEAAKAIEEATGKAAAEEEPAESAESADSPSLAPASTAESEEALKEMEEGRERAESQLVSDKDSAVLDARGDVLMKDAILLFRALCKLAMKPLLEGTRAVPGSLLMSQVVQVSQLKMFR